VIENDKYYVFFNMLKLE